MRRGFLLYVLGTSHDLQCGSDKCSPAQIAAFQAELRRIFEVHTIRCVAEEMDAEGLRQYDVTSTIAQTLASSLEIQHHYVDLTNEQRRLFSLDQSTLVMAFNGRQKFHQGFDRTLDEVRERCWVARILAKQQWPTLLICGAEHSQNVAKLWRRFGLKVIVLHSDYDPIPSSPAPFFRG
jgi:hypothetical protein